MHSRTAALGPFVLDRERQVVTCSGQPLPLGHRGYVLLETLIEAAGEPVSKQRLMDRAWPGIVVEEGNLSVQIAALRKQLGAHGGMLIVTVPRVGYRLITRTAEPCRAGPPLLAVLPFANRGSEDGYFADGVVEDIITALSRFRTFAVLARGSAFALHESNEDLPSATLGAGARYALGGSIQRRGDRLRVTARLSDLANGVQLWADSYEGAVAEVFSFQDRITESVVGVIEPTIRSAEIERARRKPAASLDAYDLLLKSLPLVHGAAPDRWEEALELLRQSAALDPAFALPRAYAAWIYEKQISMRLPLSDDSHRETCVELARAALSLGGDDPRIRAICGWVLYRVAKDIAALQGLRQAAEASPNDAVIQVLAGAGNSLHGAADDAYRCYARAYQLSPGAPDAYQSLQGMGAAELMRGNYEAAIDLCLRSLATFNDWLYTYVALAAAYAMLDRMDEARAMVRRVQDLMPNLTLKAIEDGADEEDQFALAVVPGLRKAGLPEE